MNPQFHTTFTYHEDRTDGKLILFLNFTHGYHNVNNEMGMDGINVYILI